MQVAYTARFFVRVKFPAFVGLTLEGRFSRPKALPQTPRQSLVS